jgi:acyl-coenzyme A thioesterase PaaI-like protein
MDVTAIPFNELVGLAPSDDERYLLMLPAGEKYLNHIGTVHASALFALAEATSGVVMLGELGGREDLGAVVRKVETKFRNPGHGAVYSTAALAGDKELLLAGIDERGRGFANVTGDLFDGDGKPLMRSEFEWFVTKMS